MRYYRGAYRIIARKTGRKTPLRTYILHKYSRNPFIRTLVIRTDLALQVNLSRILQDWLAFKLPVIGSSTVQCYGLQSCKSDVVERFRHRYVLQIVTAEQQTTNIAHLQMKNPIKRICFISRWLAVPINPEKWFYTVGVIIGLVDEYWFHPAKDTNKQVAIVRRVKNLLVLQRLGKFFLLYLKQN